MMQEAGEEIARHSSDDQINGKPVTVLRGSEEVLACWAHLQVGDVIKVSPVSQLKSWGVCVNVDAKSP